LREVEEEEKRRRRRKVYSKLTQLTTRRRRRGRYIHSQRSEVRRSLRVILRVAVRWSSLSAPR